MILDFIKNPGGVLVPASDMDADRMTRFKTGLVYPVELKLSRNPEFHGKVFKFLQHCFEYWSGDRQFADEKEQFDYFRKQLTITAGYFNQVFGIHGGFEITAKSLSFSNMDQDEFERCYKSMIQAAMEHIFGSLNDRELYDRLAGFF